MKQKLSAFFLIAFVLLYISISVSFFGSEMKEAHDFPMWQDEVYSLTASIRQDTFTGLLLKGAKGQGSPAPLDYWAMKAFDQIKEKISYFKLPEQVYFRLFSNGCMAFAPIFILILFFPKIVNSEESSAVKFAQLFLLFCIPFAFLFQIQIYKYAHEMRPYASWVSLYLAALSAGFLEKNRKLFCFLLILLAFTATASVFQIFAMIIVFIGIGFFEKKSFRDILISTSLLFLIPLLIAAYYCLWSGKWNYDPGVWSEFLKLWGHCWMKAVLLGAVGILCLRKQETKPFAFPAFSLIAVYLMGPFIFWLTRERGFLYADRQFIYYELFGVLLILILIELLPYLSRVLNTSSRRWGTIFLIVVCISEGMLTFRPKTVKRFGESFNKAVSVLHNPTFKTGEKLGL